MLVRAELLPERSLPGSVDLDKRSAALLERVGKPDGLPAWPAEEIQKTYTGTSGLPLMQSTLRFVETLEHAGAFGTPGWRGLDYGCGWGRIASVLLTRGEPAQLDLCDAWPRTIALLRGAGFANRVFAVAEVMADGDMPEAAYDLVYAYSVFTHLRRDAFENNIRLLRRTLRPGGGFYFTVRHADFMPRIKARPEALEALERDGFWYRPTGNSIYFGAAVVTRAYLEALPLTGSLGYLGEVDACQHLYVIRAVS
jgi:SAM-dependent methyltransferase